MVVYGVNIYRCSDANGKDWYETIINIRNQSTVDVLPRLKAVGFLGG